MSKRQGGELNHLNWNQDAEPEDAGQFRQASGTALQGRVIKTARRRRPVGGEEADQPAKSAFAGFGGFAKPATTDGTAAASAAFSFLSKKPEGEAPAAAPAGPLHQVDQDPLPPSARAVLRMPAHIGPVRPLSQLPTLVLETTHSLDHPRGLPGHVEDLITVLVTASDVQMFPLLVDPHQMMESAHYQVMLAM